MARTPSLSEVAARSAPSLLITESAYTVAPEPTSPDSQRTPDREPVLLAIQTSCGSPNSTA